MKGNDVEWREGRAEELPFPDRHFDLVICQQGLQFFTDRARAVREMRRVLRPRGRAAISELHDQVLARVAEHIRSHTGGGILILPLWANIGTAAA